ncbi:MAG: aminoacyl-tRNA hydrolase [Candidatus Harrisonbacteria bacterium]|nr:aminoacyl-tRNA hydrolase [Candidatus Harrisonbacteria bacterium]
MDTSKPNFELIIGLGNPDKKYENTYHNVGHLFADYLSSHMSHVTCHMLKSDVYMNESGAFVKKMLKKYGAKPEELLIAHDDSDITLGDYKFSFGRGAAGHHGIENIQAVLKTKNFWRLRIGIRPISPIGLIKLKRLKAGKFVLKKITAADKKILGEIFKQIDSKL